MRAISFVARLRRRAAVLALTAVSVAAISGGLPVSAEVPVKDTPPAAKDVAVCGPVSQRAAQGDAPLSVEVRDRFGPFRADQVVMVSDSAGSPIVTLACDGPSDLFRVAPGSYRVEAFVGVVRSKEVTVNVPPAGARVALTLEPAPNLPVNSPALD